MNFIKKSFQSNGAMPLIVSLPFMYYPNIINGDTQLQIFFAALITLLIYKIHRPLSQSSIFIILLAMLCGVIGIIRNEDSHLAVRVAYTHLAFIVFWILCERDKEKNFLLGIRLTVITWFAVGLYQYISVNLGWQIDFFGRYVEGRGGVPSLTAEPSFYGSISVLQMMYLINISSYKNRLYILIAGLSVLLSGSVLAIMMLIFPLLKLEKKQKIIIGIILIIITIFGVILGSFSSLLRIVSLIQILSNEPQAIISDPSLNLRFGHLYFTIISNFFQSIFYTNPLGFMAEYNIFATSSGIFISTESNYILPFAGDILYNSGIIGLLLLIAVYYCGIKYEISFWNKLQKFFLITLCLINPISFANIFFIMYLQSISNVPDVKRF
jgi:hypothetical protein